MPICSICGEEKAEGTVTIGRVVKPFYMCATLQMDHDEILAMMADAGVRGARAGARLKMEIEDEIEWDEDEWEWDDV